MMSNLATAPVVSSTAKSTTSSDKPVRRDRYVPTRHIARVTYNEDGKVYSVSVGDKINGVTVAKIMLIHGNLWALNRSNLPIRTIKDDERATVTFSVKRV